MQRTAFLAIFIWLLLVNPVLSLLLNWCFFKGAIWCYGNLVSPFNFFPILFSPFRYFWSITGGPMKVPCFLLNIIIFFLSFLPSFLLSFFPSFLLTFLPSYLLSFLPSSLPSFLPFLLSFLWLLLLSFTLLITLFYFLHFKLLLSFYPWSIHDCLFFQVLVHF